MVTSRSNNPKKQGIVGRDLDGNGHILQKCMTEAEKETSLFLKDITGTSYGVKELRLKIMVDFSFVRS